MRSRCPASDSIPAAENVLYSGLEALSQGVSSERITRASSSAYSSLRPKASARDTAR